MNIKLILLPLILLSTRAVNTAQQKSLKEMYAVYYHWETVPDDDICEAIKNGARLDKVDLNHAVSAGHLKAAQLLLTKGYDINEVVRGNAPIHHASSSEMIHFLVEKGANILAQDCIGQTALHHAVQESLSEYCDSNKEFSRIKTFLEISENSLLQIKDDNSNTPLDRLLYQNPDGGRRVNLKLEILKLFLDAGSRPREYVKRRRLQDNPKSKFYTLLTQTYNKDMLKEKAAVKEQT